MLRCVVLLHSTPDGGSHFDWMVERLMPETEYRLLTWRCNQSPAEPAWDGHCERIVMHRAEYLEYEGVLSQGRGAVRRVARGEVLQDLADHRRADFTIRWADRTVRYQGRVVDEADRWVFTADLIG